MNQQNAKSPMPASMTRALLALVAIGFAGIGTMLFVCAIHPFGASAPSPTVCWIVGSGLWVVSLGLGAGAVHYGNLAGRTAEAREVRKPRIPDPTESGATAEMPGHDRADSAMASTLLRDPALQQSMGALIEALIQAAPDHYSMIHLLVEVRRANGKVSILFTHGSPVLLGEYSTLVPDEISNASFRVVDQLLRQDDRFPGFEIVLRKTGAAKWSADFHRLDEPGPEWTNLPRYPLRVCGHGLSLAPIPDTIFRWTHDQNLPGIIAVSRKASNEPFKKVQITFGDANPALHWETQWKGRNRSFRLLKGQI